MYSSDWFPTVIRRQPNFMSACFPKSCQDYVRPRRRLLIWDQRSFKKLVHRRVQLMGG